jgi:CheY-like chemotaxis protein
MRALPCLPLRAGVTAARHSGPVPISLGGATTPLDGCDVLLVEDSMIIALDGEDALRELGAASVSTAPTVRDALRLLEHAGRPFAFALLDFNLGVDTSAPVADRLTELGVPLPLPPAMGRDRRRALARGSGDQQALWSQGTARGGAPGAGIAPSSHAGLTAGAGGHTLARCIGTAITPGERRPCSAT